MIDIIARKAIDYLLGGYHAQESIDMAIDVCMDTTAYPLWVRGRVESEVYHRLANMSWPQRG